MPTIQELLAQHGQSIVRGQLRKIVEIYDPEWIMAHELAQNAIDAIQANDAVVEGQVLLTLDVDQSSVTVEDNGIGFKHDLNLLCPGGSGNEKRLASRSPAKGYQGVGLKAVMYSTERFELESQTVDERWVFIVEGLADYISPEKDLTPDYMEEVKGEGSTETYTKITAKFPEGNVASCITDLNRFLGPDAVKWEQLYQAEKDDLEREPYEFYIRHFLQWYFRSQSYVGCVNRLIGVPVRNINSEELEDQKPITIKVILRSNSNFANIGEKLGEWLQNLDTNELEIDIPSRNWDYAEIAETNSQRAVKYRIAPVVVSKKPSDDDWEQFKPTFRNKFLNIKLLPNEGADEFREKYHDIIALLERPRSREKAENYSDVFKAITGIYLAIGRTTHFETLGLENRGQKLIAANGTPTAHDLIVRSTSSTWYLETIHMIINVDATLNLGKRHLVNTRLVGRINQFFEACYPTLVNISKLFVERPFEPPGSDSLPEVLDTLRLSRQGLPFTRFPLDESTLIGLFSSTMSIVESDFSVFGFFGAATYDGKFLWQRDEVKSENDFSILEFKVKLDSLIHEFEHATFEKEFRHLSLIVVWNRTCSVSGWSVKGISAARRNDMEQRGVSTDLLQYILEDREGNFCPLICVADLIKEKLPICDGEAENDNLDAFIRDMDMKN